MEQKIYIGLKGGLGNQLFQYAFGLHLVNRGLPVAGFYLNFKEDRFGRSYALDQLLSIPPTLVTELPPSTVIINSESDDAIIDYLQKHSHDSVLLDGYFQNIAYLHDTQFEKRIQHAHSVQPLVAVHVRRGDYGHHGILPFSYYTQALAKLDTPAFHVFSDEPNFAEYMFSKLPGYQGIIPPDLAKPSKEFLQLSSYAGVVMANSSFSWLAAYLAFKRHQATICCPSEWSLLSHTPNHSEKWHSIETRLIRP